MTTIVLLIIGILLIAINVKVVKREKNSFKNVFDNASTNMKDYDVEIGKIRKEFAETVFELQKEVEGLKDRLDKNYNENDKNISYGDIETNFFNNNKMDSIEISNYKDDVKEVKTIDKAEEINKNEYRDNNEINNAKVDDIEKLIKEGLSVDSISKKLGIGKGEVLLIQKLYIK
ncbi:hypothetical protein [Clostridium sp.]|jgi:competence protein ComGC|uniref:DUF6115 domain-containing protein n=1 Tax=Clostridium sp. TaxID=1506 RepID=UPI00258C20BA|nr:hypothetical protein [Clostridium sp.]MDF2504513.1 hypothetical protein [Clostridium sp.]